MQINIDRKTGVLLGVIVLLAAAVVSLSVNRSDNGDTGSSSGHMGHGSSSSSNANYTGADIMFLQMMIPHHQQAIDISNLAMKASQDSELIELAKIIARDQAAEIKQMKAWLTDAGASEDMGHSMDGMGGMLNDDELAALNAATSKEFDVLWLKGMTEHHDGAIHMTQMIEDAENADIKAFGTKVIKDQSEQIDQMKKMLARLS
jgi:uncharacterized protein (DUF305 family)|uniref:DUF305 domain-containing protein n=2 Tax=Candidatus Planktophila sp. TaxID=2175601 RepID=UPI00404ACABE